MKATNIIWDTDGENINLPTEIDIPDGMTDEDEISDFLSDTTGFCHEGFTLEFDDPRDIIIRLSFLHDDIVTTSEYKLTVPFGITYAQVWDEFKKGHADCCAVHNTPDSLIEYVTKKHGWVYEKIHFELEMEFTI
ncbi:hypothetical protein J6A31_04920 [bacterium]|nr:hypothetical protein [bacterium]